MGNNPGGVQRVTRQRHLILDRGVAFFRPLDEQFFVGIELVTDDRKADLPQVNANLVLPSSVRFAFDERVAGKALEHADVGLGRQAPSDSSRTAMRTRTSVPAGPSGLSTSSSCPSGRSSSP